MRGPGGDRAGIRSIPAKGRLWRLPFLFAATVVFNVSASPDVPSRAKVCILVFTQRQGSVKTSFSCDGGRPETFPDSGKSLLEEQSGKLRLFMDNMLVPRSCSAVNTPDDKDKTYQFTCVLYS